MDDYIGVEVVLALPDGDRCGAILEGMRDDCLLVSRYDDKVIEVPWSDLLGVTGWRRQVRA